MRKLTLDEADRIIDAAIAKGRELGLGRLTVVVLDEGGHAIAMKREDGSEFLRPRIATAKAWGALGMGLPSRLLFERSQRMPVFFGALSDLAEGGLVALPGGVIIRDDDGSILGAVGVSGDVSEPDEVCAVAGVEAVGLGADVGDNPLWGRP
ncbi:MAG TPA: heme-binding protein [Acidimicrobiia bacterium]